MAKIERFSFYKNIHDLIKLLPSKKRANMYQKICDFMFDDKEPKFYDYDEINLWSNLERVLSKQKRNNLNGQHNIGKNDEKVEPKEEPKTQPKVEPKEEPKTQPKQDLYFYLYFNNNYINNLIKKYNYSFNNNLNDNINITLNKIKNIVNNWLVYKKERHENYKEQGIKNLLKTLSEYIELYGIDLVEKIVNQSIANNYQGIIFDRLTKMIPTKVRTVPEWHNKEIESDLATDEEIKEFEEKLNEKRKT